MNRLARSLVFVVEELDGHDAKVEGDPRRAGVVRRGVVPASVPVEPDKFPRPSFERVKVPETRLGLARERVAPPHSRQRNPHVHLPRLMIIRLEAVRVRLPHRLCARQMHAHRRSTLIRHPRHTQRGTHLVPHKRQQRALKLARRACGYSDSSCAGRSSARVSARAVPRADARARRTRPRLRRVIRPLASPSSPSGQIRTSTRRTTPRVPRAGRR